MTKQHIDEITDTIRLLPKPLQYINFCSAPQYVLTCIIYLFDLFLIFLNTCSANILSEIEWCANLYPRYLFGFVYKNRGSDQEDDFEWYCTISDSEGIQLCKRYRIRLLTYLHVICHHFSQILNLLINSKLSSSCLFVRFIDRSD